MHICNQYTEHGIKVEDDARKVFCKNNPSLKVFQTGLLVSSLNSWLSYSPDGVVFFNGLPDAILEIKVPFKGKDSTILEALQVGSFKTCLVTKKQRKKNEKKGKEETKEELVFPLQLEEKHKYYAQVQLGMFMLDVPKAYFVMYSSFDKSIETIEVKYNESFTTLMLRTVKKCYFDIMLHTVYCDKSLCGKFSPIQEE